MNRTPTSPSGARRRVEDRARHHVVAARLEHQRRCGSSRKRARKSCRFSLMVGAVEQRRAARDQPHRVAAGVAVDAEEGVPHPCPSPLAVSVPARCLARTAFRRHCCGCFRISPRSAATNSASFGSPIGSARVSVRCFAVGRDPDGVGVPVGAALQAGGLLALEELRLLDQPAEIVPLGPVELVRVDRGTSREAGKAAFDREGDLHRIAPARVCPAAARRWGPVARTARRTARRRGRRRGPSADPDGSGGGEPLGASRARSGDEGQALLVRTPTLAQASWTASCSALPMP